MAVDKQKRGNVSAATPASSIGRFGDAARDGRGDTIRRAKRVEEEENDADTAKRFVPLQDKRDAVDAVESARLQYAVAEFLETVEVQAAIIFLIGFDLCSIMATTHLHDQSEIARLQATNSKSKAAYGATTALDVEGSVGASSLFQGVLLRLLDSFTGFTIFFFLIELVVLMITFRRAFFSHVGYVVDLVIVFGSIATEIYTQSKGVLRVWRVFRLVSTLLDRERKEHDLTQEALELEKTRLLQLQLEKQAVEESLKREYESRAGVERMLQGYKDEADTLREALNIAARAVAEATMQNAMSIPEETQDDVAAEEQDGAYKVDNPPAEREYYAEVLPLEAEYSEWSATAWSGEGAVDVPAAPAGEPLDDLVSSEDDEQGFADAVDA